MTENIRIRLTACLMAVCLIFALMPTDTYGSFAAEKNYPYAIQVGVFGNATAANKFYNAHKAQLKQGFVLKAVQYHVLYGVYESKTAATQKLPEARRIDPNAYIFKLNAASQSQAAAFMKKQATVKTATPKPAPAPVSALPTTKAASPPTTSPAPSVPKTVPPTTPIVATASSKVKVYNVPLQDDVVINGVFGVASISFNVSSDWKIIDGAYLEMYLSHADQKIFPESSATLLLNDVPIKSYYLDSKGENPVKLLISIPKESVRTGFNELKLKTYLRTSADLCENEGNPANWIVVLKKSYLHLPYTDQLDTTQLTEYPYPYVKNGQDQPIDFSFIYDTSKHDPEVLRGIFTLTSDLGRLMPFKTLSFKFAEPQKLSKNASYIYIGTEIPNYLQPLMPQSFKKPSSDLYLAEVPLNNGSRLLLIISKNPALLSPLSNMLNYSQVVKQLNKSSVSFVESDLVKPVDKTSDQLLTFKELGYGNVTFEGTKAASAGYFIDTPGNWQVLEGSKLVVQSRFSALVDAPNSTLSASVNGIPIGSRILDGNYKDGQIFEFILPKDVLQSNRFNVVLAYSLGGEFKCDSLRSNKGIWAFISNDSYIQFVQEPKERYRLEDLPSPLVADGSYSQLNLALDPQAGFKELTLAANLMAKLSHQTTQSGNFTLSFGTLKPKTNNIVIATANSKLIASTNGAAIVPYNANFTGFENHPSLFLLANEQSHYATAQLINHEKEKVSTLWITSLNPDGFEWVGKYLYDLGLNSQVKGEAIFVSRDGLLQTVETLSAKDKDKNNPLVNLTEAPRATFENIRNFLIFLGAMLFIIILLIIMNNKKKKGRG